MGKYPGKIIIYTQDDIMRVALTMGEVPIECDGHEVGIYTLDNRYMVWIDLIHHHKGASPPQTTGAAPEQ